MQKAFSCSQTPESLRKNGTAISPDRPRTHEPAVAGADRGVEAHDDQRDRDGDEE